MRNKRFLFAYILFISPLISMSQSVLSPLGHAGIINNIIIEYTIGEPIISTIANNSNTLTQGFHQPKNTSSSAEDFENKLLLTLFPNPTKSTVTIQSSNTDKFNLIITITDYLGRILNTENIDSSNWKFDLTNLPNTCYYFNIYSISDNKTETFKIIKL